MTPRLFNGWRPAARPGQDEEIEITSALGTNRMRRGRLVRLARSGSGLGLVILALLSYALLGGYDRAATLSGRTEILRVSNIPRLFRSWNVDSAELRQDGSAPVPAPFQISLAEGAGVVFRRQGRGALTMSFVAPDRAQTASGPADAQSACPEGEDAVGQVLRPAPAPALPLCERASLVLNSTETGPDGIRQPLPPTVLAFQGFVQVGEEVRVGGGSQPILLEGQAILFVRHRRFQDLCDVFVLLRHFCDRFQVTAMPIPPGYAVMPRVDSGSPAPSSGFIRFDASDVAPGMLFDLASPSATLQIRRINGATFDVEESLFERASRSPASQAFGAFVAILTLIWWLFRLPDRVAEFGRERAQRWSRKRPTFLPVLLPVIALAATQAPAAAEQAYVDVAGQAPGQAILRSRLDRCYAITLQHVVGDERAGELITERRRVGRGRLLRLVPAAPEALALMSVSEAAAERCPPFEGAPQLDAVLQARTTGTLRRVSPDGVLLRLPVTILQVDIETLEVRADQGQHLTRGMSGGTVFLGDQAVGLLVSVDRSGIGQVMRLDRAFERLAPYFSMGGATPLAQVPPPPSLSCGSGRPCLARIVESSALPSSPGLGAENLVTRAAPWRVAGPGPVYLVASLGPEAVTVRGVSFSVAGLPDPPRAVQVDLAPTPDGPWVSRGVAALDAGDESQRLAVNPAAYARFIRLRVSGSQPGERTMALLGLGFD